MKNFRIIGILLISLLTFNANAQTDKATTAKIVAQKNYVFVATSATPLNSMDVNRVLSQMSGGASSNINLTGDSYDLRITADSVVAYLPYYGRSYSAPLGRDESGYKFTAKDFTYTIKKVKRGWGMAETHLSRRFRGILIGNFHEAVRMVTVGNSGLACRSAE